MSFPQPSSNSSKKNSLKQVAGDAEQKKDDNDSTQHLLNHDEADSADYAENNDIINANPTPLRDLEAGKKKRAPEFIQEPEYIYSDYFSFKTGFSLSSAACVLFLYYGATKDLDTDTPWLHFILMICGMYVNFLQTLLFSAESLDFFMDKNMVRRATMLFLTLVLAGLGDAPYGLADYENDHSIWEASLVLYGNFSMTAYAIALKIVEWIIDKCVQLYDIFTMDDATYQDNRDTATVRRAMANFYRSATQSLKINNIAVPYNLTRLERLEHILNNMPKDSSTILFDVTDKNVKYYVGRTAELLGGGAGVGSNEGYSCSNVEAFGSLGVKNIVARVILGVGDMTPIYVISWGAGQVFKAFAIGIWDLIALLKKLCTGEKKFSDIKRPKFEDVIPILAALPSIFSYGTSYALQLKYCPNNGWFLNPFTTGNTTVSTDVVNLYWTKEAVVLLKNGYKIRFGTEGEKSALHSQNNFEDFCKKTKALPVDEIKEEVSAIHEHRSTEWDKCVSNLSQKEKAAFARLDIWTTSENDNSESSAPTSKSNGHVETSQNKREGAESKTSYAATVVKATQSTTSVSSSRWTIFNCCNRDKNGEYEKLMGNTQRVSDAQREGYFNRVMRRLPSFCCPG